MSKIKPVIYRVRHNIWDMAKQTVVDRHNSYDLVSDIIRPIFSIVPGIRGNLINTVEKYT